MSWKILSSKMLVDFPLFKVFKDLVELPNGFKLDYCRVMKLPVVTILPVFADKIVMIKQYRYPIKAHSLELPAGHMKIGETPEACARRELKEETGFTANKIEKLLSYHPSSEYSDQIYHIFIGKEMVEGKPNREEYEIMDVEILDVGSAIEKILEGKITDGRTITTLFFAKLFKII